MERYERLVQKEEEMVKVVPAILIDDMVTKETSLIASQEIEIGK